LFRIRTVVNDLRKYVVPSQSGVTTTRIGQILVDRKLSKISILESQNKLKRARDHALNASYLGFLIPIPGDHQNIYIKSPIGELLSEYKFAEECPRDLHEAAIFIDRMMKLKLTNAYDSRATYSKFHTRPFLSILTVLNYQKLHISQLHYLLSITKDLATTPNLLKEKLETFSKYPPYKDDSIPRFIDDFKMRDKLTTKEIGRSTKPLLDWVQQGGLANVGKDGWCIITENGIAVQNYYSTFYPIWFDQLGFNAAMSAALLLIYSYVYFTNARVNKRKLPNDARETLDLLATKFKIWDSSLSRLKRPIDFDLNYDVPYEIREDTRRYIYEFCKDLKFPKIDLNSISVFSLHQIEEILKGTSTEKRQFELHKALGIEIPRRECFQTDFEWQVCIRLRLFQLPANPYQGEFEGETDLPMATDNPDIIIRNNIKSLVECKSRNEWGNIVKLDKRVGGELMMYQSYAEDVNADSAIFVCDVEGFDKDNFLKTFASRGNKLNKIVILKWAFLDYVQKDRSLLQRLESTIKEPENVDPINRILA